MPGPRRLLLVAWAASGFLAFVGFQRIASEDASGLEAFAFVGALVLVGLAVAFVWAWLRLLGLVHRGLRLVGDEPSRR